MNKTFEIKMTITIPEEAVNNEEFIEFKTAILNGEMKRDLMGVNLVLLNQLLH